MPVVKRAKELIDEHHELAAIALFVLGVLLILFNQVGELAFLSMLFFSLITWLGPKYYYGVKLTKDGLEIGGSEEASDEEEMEELDMEEK